MEHDVCSVVETDGIDVGVASRLGAAAQVEDPLLRRGIEAEARVRHVGIHGFVHGGHRATDDLREHEAVDHCRRADGDSIGIADTELQRDGAALLPDAGAVPILSAARNVLS